MAIAAIEVVHSSLIDETFNRLWQIRGSGLLRVSLDARYMSTELYAQLVQHGKHYLQLYFDRQKQEQQEAQRGVYEGLKQLQVVVDSVTSRQQQRQQEEKRKTQTGEATGDWQGLELQQAFGYLKPSQGEATDFMQRVLRACMVQEETILHVSRLLGLERLFLTSSCCENLPPSALLAVIGELVFAWQQLLDRQKRRLYPPLPEPSDSYVQETLERIIEFLEEAGRDRLTYYKEAVSVPDFAAATDGLRELTGGGSSKDPYYGGGLGEQAERKYLTSIYMFDRPHKGDACLERMLHSGSLSLILERMHTLLLGDQAQGLKNIRWSIIRQAPFMNKTRQLIFTRLAQVLCRRVLCLAPPVASPFLGTEDEFGKEDGGEKNEEEENKRQIRLAAAVRIALVDSGVPQWCYETENQKVEVVLCAGISLKKAGLLESVLRVRVFRGFVDISQTDACPTESLLIDSFASWTKTCGYPYSVPRLPDSNLYRYVPVEYKSSLDPAPPALAFLNAKTTRLVSDASLSGALAYTLAPISSTLIDTEKFTQAISDFLEVKPVSGQ